MASVFSKMKMRSDQRKGRSFIKRVSNKTSNEIKQIFLDSKEYENNETVLTFLFFNYPDIISVLPIEFQKRMVNMKL